MTDTRPVPETSDESARSDATWWRQAAVYQIYPRSFADANGDGIGDVRGITSRVPYLKKLGIDAVWLSPFYPSALADGGYDVDDYRNVDPRLGTLDDFDDMVDALHRAGIKLIVDIVPNHSSNRHEWFTQALAAPKGSPERDRYIFRDGLGDNGQLPPADWTSAFGGLAWEPVGDGQWYMHYFATEQPDFNWDNREVRDDFLATLRFWSDRGVDGFRVDVAHGLAKELPAVLPSQAELDAMEKTTGQHPLWDRDEVHEIYAEWRGVFNEYDPPASPSPRPGSRRPSAGRATRVPRGSGRRSTSTCSRRTSIPRSSARSSRRTSNRRRVRARRRRGSSRTTTSFGTRRATDSRRLPDAR